MRTSSAPTLPGPQFHPASVTVWLARILGSIGAVALLIAALVVSGAAAFELRYRGQIYPGVRAWGVDLSGMSPEDAALALITTLDYPRSPAFIFWDGGQQWTATPAELGLTFDVAATVAEAYGLGRSGNLLSDWRAQFDAWYAGAQVAPVMRYDEGRARAFLNRVETAVFLPPVEALLRAEGTSVTATPGQIGRQLDVEAMLVDLRPRLFAMERGQLPLILIETPPLVLDATAQAEVAQRMLSQPLVLRVADAAAGDPGPWTIEPPTLGEWLRVERVQDGPNAARFVVRLDEAALRATLEPLAEPLARSAQNARFIFNDDTRQLDVLQPSIDGRRLDVDATLAAINEQLPQGVHTLPLVFHLEKPAVASDATAAGLGITELVVEHTTLFGGSTAERVNNIRVASARFHGLLIAPGAVFSFNEHLGDVSLDTGFAEALIIFGGRTIRGVGGGVCQVSTTVFRAAYFGGFPIVERYSHAYRVGYYERGLPGAWSGPGLDATVYAPLVDFKFQNDTPHWLLMEAYVNASSGRLTWKFYSTSDGRQVEVGQAVVQNEVPAPDPLYELDPALAQGEIKQVDYAAVGADVSVTRIVRRDGVRINTGELPLRTHYQPWRAVFEYGPGTEGIPTPTPAPGATPTP